ncbi:MAG TPA: PQQ-binding-like beta-propeller repeat protein, partial [Gemmatales bacterium]|nr:PQQ-binding-like beta-propeller repeat protein [Gemmatales bacterium]
MRVRAAAVAVWLSATAWTWVYAEEWPQFRGPDGTGIVKSGTLPTEWDGEKNIAWKTKVPGYAWSQPIVWGDKVYVTTAVADKQNKPAGGGMRRPGGEGGRPPGDPPPPRPTGPGQGRPGGGQPGGPGGPGGGRGAPPPPDEVYRWELFCLDRGTGHVLWSKRAAEHKPAIPTHRTNTYASETPVTDGERLYVYFGMVGLYCFDMEGKLLWEKKIGPYPMASGWGTGSSPILAGDLVYLQCDNERESFLVAFDKKSGEERWRVPREERSTWSTPFVWKNKVRTELVTAGSRKVVAYDPATGKVLWEISRNTGRCSATPVGNDELL